MNVVFDLGAVVFNWNPDEIIARVFDKNDLQKKIKAEVFGHPDWVELDRGTLDLEKAIERAAVRTGLSMTEIRKLMNQVPLSLTPKPAMVELIHKVKGNGNRLYVLSNMQFASINHIEQKYSFWDVFEGRVISCRIRLVKPEVAIYQYLLAHYGLDASQTIFIDDKLENLKAASKVGIRGIKFETPFQCELELKEVGCI